MNRRPTTQDVSWFLDLHRNGQLDLDPSYQRRSVWSPKDRRFFLDTIFRGYPSPAVFVHKTIESSDRSTYHVVDGKQRLMTIIMFFQDKLRISKEFGDVRIDGKTWSDLQEERELRRRFLDYPIPVEQLDTDEIGVLNEVFDRLNRNSKRLTRQELRHARYSGWLASFVEKEVDTEEWKTLGIVTTARSRRMADSQALAELFLVCVANRITGFDQDEIDAAYASYDLEPDNAEEPWETDIATALEDAQRAFEGGKRGLLGMQAHNGCIGELAKQLMHLYSLWSVLVLNGKLLPEMPTVAERYTSFMAKVNDLRDPDQSRQLLAEDKDGSYRAPWEYWQNCRGPNTDLGPRTIRHDALLRALRS